MPINVDLQVTLNWPASPPVWLSTTIQSVLAPFIRKIEELIMALQESIDGLTSDAADLTNDATALGTQVTSLNTTITNLQAQIAAAGPSVTQAQLDQLAAAQQAYANVHSSLSAILSQNPPPPPVTPPAPQQTKRP